MTTSESFADTSLRKSMKMSGVTCSLAAIMRYSCRDDSLEDRNCSRRASNPTLDM